MNGMDDKPLAPQTFLYGCVLEAGKEVVFNPDDDEFEHQLDLRMACVDPSTKDELHMVEVEGTDTEGQTVKAVLVSLKPSTLPSVCLGGFTMTPPAVFRLKAGSGPIHISGQHLVMMETDDTFDEEEDEEEEEEEEEVSKGASSKKRLASSPAAKSVKKMKMEVDEDDDDDDEDEDDDDEDDDEDESDEEESPVKAKPTPTKQKSPAQNGKSSSNKAGPKQEQKTPKEKGNKSPKTPVKISEVKVKLTESISKGVQMPKVQAKFVNFIKNCHKVVSEKDIAELWAWRQTLKDAK